MVLHCRLWTTLFLAQKDAQFEWETFCTHVMKDYDVELAALSLKNMYQEMDAVGLQTILNQSFEGLKSNMDATAGVASLEDPGTEHEGAAEGDGEFEGSDDA